MASGLFLGSFVEITKDADPVAVKVVVLPPVARARLAHVRRLLDGYPSSVLDAEPALHVVVHHHGLAEDPLFVDPRQIPWSSGSILHAGEPLNRLSLIVARASIPRTRTSTGPPSATFIV